MKDEASYTCDSCGEEIVVPIDLSAETSQEYVEDCPVCCRPNVIHVEVDEDGDVRVWEREQHAAALQKPAFHLPLCRRPEHPSFSPGRRPDRSACLGVQDRPRHRRAAGDAGDGNCG